MTEFLGTGGGQIACEVTGLTEAAEDVVAARPELAVAPPTPNDDPDPDE